MDVFYSYTYGTAGWFALQAIPLIISPTIIISLLSAEVRDPASLEQYFSRSLGLALLALGIMVLLLSGSVPLTSSYSESASEASDPKAPYAVPTVIVSMIYHSAAAFYCYGRYCSMDGQTTFVLGCIGSGGLASMGLWILLFGTGGGHISRKTGADKRTSNFPFGNKESARARKKQWGKAVD